MKIIPCRPSDPRRPGQKGRSARYDGDSAGQNERSARHNGDSTGQNERSARHNSHSAGRDGRSARRNGDSAGQHERSAGQDGRSAGRDGRGISFRLRAHPLALLLPLVAALMGLGQETAALLIALVCHECAHLLAARALGARVDELRLPSSSEAISAVSSSFRSE